MRKLFMVCIGLAVLTACLTPQQQEDVKRTADGINSVAPLLPPPFGLIAGAVATALTGIASIGANKASNAAYAKNKTASPLIRLTTDHASSILAVAVPLLVALRASGVLHFSEEELLMITTTFAAPVATKKVMRRKAA